MIGVTCINCRTVRRYYVYFTVGDGGWVSEIPKEKNVKIPMPETASIPMDALTEFINNEIPQQKRVRIQEKFN